MNIFLNFVIHRFLLNFYFKLSLTDDENLMQTEEAWDVLARKELVLEGDRILKECAETGQNADFTIAQYEQTANNIYLEAIDKLNKSEKIWLIYIDFCFERLNLKSKYLNDEVSILS